MGIHDVRCKGWLCEIGIHDVRCNVYLCGHGIQEVAEHPRIALRNFGPKQSDKKAKPVGSTFSINGAVLNSFGKSDAMLLTALFTRSSNALRDVFPSVKRSVVMRPLWSTAKETS